jgi:phage FluMu protein Com
MNNQTEARTVRCDACNARLMDTNGEPPSEDQERGALKQRITVWIKCWRCKQIREVHLSYNEGGRYSDHEAAA